MFVWPSTLLLGWLDMAHWTFTALSKARSILGVSPLHADSMDFVHGHSLWCMCANWKFLIVHTLDHALNELNWFNVNGFFIMRRRECCKHQYNDCNWEMRKTVLLLLFYGIRWQHKKFCSIWWRVQNVNCGRSNLAFINYCLHVWRHEHPGPLPFIHTWHIKYEVSL